MKWTDWITLAIALLGAVLGIYNAWQGWRDRAVRFRVRVTQAIGIGFPTETCVSIEVTNLSSFPITIGEVGLVVGRPSGSLPRRAMLPPDNIINGSIPMRIEPRHSASVVGWASSLPRGENYDHVYARSSGGEIGFATSPALMQWIRSVRRD